MRHLRVLEAQSINILREAYDSLDLALAWSKGTESTVLLWLARKAFNGRIPIPVIQIDRGHNKPEWIEYRDRLRREWHLNQVVKQTRHERSTHSNITDLEMIEEAMRTHCWTAVILDTRADREGTSHHFSLYQAYSEWDLLAQQPQRWDPHRISIPDNSYIRVHPLLDWTELDIQAYIQSEHIPLPNPSFDQDSILRLRNLAWNSSSNTRQPFVSPLP